MVDENRPEDPRLVSGEFMPANQNTPDVMTRNPLRQLFDQLFHFPIWNRRKKKAYEAQREMVEEATKLGKALVDHQRQQGRLLDMVTILDMDADQRYQERVEARNRLNDAKLEYEAWEQKQIIAKANKELEVKQTEMNYRAASCAVSLRNSFLPIAASCGESDPHRIEKGVRA